MAASLYNLKQWHVLRARQLRLEPLCRFCAQMGRRSPATVVDHIKPHCGDEAKFFDPANLQSLCKTCDDAAKQAQEKSGHLRGSDAAGMPLDATHPWFRVEG